MNKNKWNEKRCWGHIAKSHMPVDVRPEKIPFEIRKIIFK